MRPIAIFSRTAKGMRIMKILEFDYKCEHALFLGMVAVSGVSGKEGGPEHDVM